MRKIALGLSLALVLTIPWEGIIEHPLLGSASRMVGLGLVAFWAVTVLVTGRFRTLTALHRVAAMFVGWNAVSVFWSADPVRSAEHAVTWLQLLVLFCIIWDLYTAESALLAGLQVYIFGAYFVVGSTLVNYLAGNTFAWERFSAAGTNPNDLGAVLALGLPFAWYLIARESAGKIPPWLKWVNYPYIPIALFGIALAGARTALLATVPCLVLALASVNRLRLSARIAIFILAIMAAVALLPLVPQASLERLGTTRTELAEGDFTGRARLWREGLASFEEHPLLGVGSNMYRSVNTEGKVAHNSYLSVLVELGIVGFILFLTILAFVVGQALGQARFDKYFWLAVLATWAIAAASLTWEYGKPTWFVFSLVIASSSLQHRRKAATPPVLRSPFTSEVIVSSPARIATSPEG